MTVPTISPVLFSLTSASSKRSHRTSKAKLARPAIRQRLVDIELATASALRALQMDIDGDAGTPSGTVLKRARAALR